MIDTLATGTRPTVTPAVAVTPSLVAVMVVLPAEIAETTPLLLTEAMAALALLHDTTRPVRITPVESRAVAASVAVCPTNRLGVDGATEMDDTGSNPTVTSAVAVRAPLTAVMVVLP